jgi:hypothetical protein
MAKALCSRYCVVYQESKGDNSKEEAEGFNLKGLNG